MIPFARLRVQVGLYFTIFGVPALTIIGLIKYFK
jgi:hypothetical protein